MLRYLLRRLAALPLVLWILVTIVFFMVRMAPGGPFDGERSLDPAIEEALQAKYHLDEPLVLQYLRFLWGLLQGDLGPSFTQPAVSVNEIIGNFLPTSLWLGSLAMIIALIIGVGAGVWAGVRHNKLADQGTMIAAMLGLSVPTFVIGPLLMLVFATWLGWLPIAGYGGWYNPAYLILPATTLAAPFAARIARLTRAGMLEIIGEDFIRSARAMGLRERQVVWGHAFRGAMVPVMGFLGPAIAQAVTGSLVVEQIFQVPGLGREFVLSAFNRDYTLVMGTVIVYGILLIVLNLLSDLVYAALDPRVRLS